MLLPRSPKKLAAPSLPVRCPYHGAALLAASAGRQYPGSMRFLTEPIGNQ
jgi:hypothetical protein